MPRTISVPRQYAPAKPVRQPAVRRSAEPMRARRATVVTEVWPLVSLHLPIRNEAPESVRRTLDAVARLDYPDFELLVIDSNTEDPALWEPVAEHCARLGPRFRFFHLGPWPGGKAGALNFALSEASADAAVIGALDSGTEPRPAWLRRMVTCFADPAVGFAWSPAAEQVASPWTAGSMQTDADMLPQDAFALVRRQAIEASGGWAQSVLALDAELAVRLMRDGWRGACCPDIFGGSPAPGGFAEAARRHFRQAYGATQVLCTHSGALLSPTGAGLTLLQRGKLLAGWLPKLGDALCLLLLVAALAWSAGLVLNPAKVGFPGPVLTLVPILLMAMTLVRGLHRRPETSWRAWLRTALTGLALGPAGGNGVWKALLGGEATDPPGPPAISGLAGRLAPVRMELSLLLLTWTAAAGIAALRGLAERGSVAWCVMLLVQSLPCLAAVLAALTQPARKPGRISRLPRSAVPL